MSVTVIVPATASALTTPENVRLDVSVPATISNAQLTRLIAQASGSIVRHCGRSFGRETVRETFSLSFRPPSEIILSRDPIQILSISSDGVPLGGETDWVREGATLYRMSGGRPALWQGTTTAVEYTTGWILPGEAGSDLPAEVERAAILMVGAMVASRGRDPNLKGENVVGVGSFTYGTPSAEGKLAHPEAEALLWPYVRGVIA
ncbi:hypothetical protein [Methylobacterium nodulans]|uniref:Phage gp6-like head-tail connector protein n=1 Tax=Methylobacterium nodulans (strain LMG 21967 / CNCM I-2342 / ORS 2060) TaxID=460265 RepID=B8ITN7_METNO|nr:hypothetical protein [Methylobacterium nodulans]ACL58953.1 conserved hypothetical protein [Methylobacterium nodulans ORS 2060]